jgi:translation initiation factor 3 subunit D
MSLPIDLSGISNTWGPQTAVPESLRFSDIPYAPFSKGDKLGKAADWQQQEFARDSKDKKRNQRDYFHAYGASAASSFAAEAQDGGEDFEVVDNSKQLQRSQVTQTTVLKRGARQHNNAQGGAPFQKKSFATKRPFAPNPQQGGRRYWKDEKPERVRDSSVKIEDSWTVVSDIELNKLTKLNFEVAQPSELGTYGILNIYNKRMEKGGVPLKTIDKNIYNPTASDDPVIQQLQSQEAAQVFTTDSVISQLMCAARSVYSWDIVATKKNGQIFLDKREGSQIDRLTVDENAQDAPSDAVDSNINNATKLSLEAMFVNQNLLANVVADDQVIPLEHSNPFHTSNEPLLSKGYKYKKWEFKTGEEDETPLSIVIRTEFDTKDVTSNQLLSVKALNEYQNNGIDWKTKLSSQRGAIIAAELKNNNNKLSKWTQQALLAGVDTIKLGFVSRTNFKDNTKHTILGVASYQPKDLALQINLSSGNGWGIVKSYIDILNSQEDGKFVILKNPNEPKLTVYRVPENSFADE